MSLYPFLRPFAFALDAETAHRATIAALRAAPGGKPQRFDPALTTSVAGLGFPSPYTFDLATVLTGGAGYDTILGIRQSAIDNDENSATSFTLTFDDTGTGAGTFDDIWPDLVFEFEPGVTSMADFEAAIATSTWLHVVTGSTIPISLLGDAAADTFGPVTVATAGDPPVIGGLFAGALE